MKFKTELYLSNRVKDKRTGVVVLSGRLVMIYIIVQFKDLWNAFVGKIRPDNAVEWYSSFS